MGTLLQDLRYGLRMLAKNPGFAVVVVITWRSALGRTRRSSPLACSASPTTACLTFRTADFRLAANGDG